MTYNLESVSSNDTVPLANNSLQIPLHMRIYDWIIAVCNEPQWRHVHAETRVQQTPICFPFPANNIESTVGLSLNQLRASVAALVSAMIILPDSGGDSVWQAASATGLATSGREFNCVNDKNTVLPLL